MSSINLQKLTKDELVCYDCGEKCVEGYTGHRDDKAYCVDCLPRDSEEEEEEEDRQCDSCGTTCLDHTSNKGRGSESPCQVCMEHRCKMCPCECE